MRTVLGISLCLLFSANFASAQNDFLAVQKRVQKLFSQYKEAVVRVRAFHLNSDETGNAQTELRFEEGSGFFISREGLILVSANRVRDAERIEIIHGGTGYLAEVLGYDNQVNVALLKAVFLPDSFDFIRMNESPALPEPGTFVLAITRPSHLDTSPRLTMISGQQTGIYHHLFPTTYLRIDSILRLGESGSPVIDLQGRLVGMMVASNLETQSSFLLPAKAINKIKDDLLLEGSVSYSGVGFEVNQDTVRGGWTRVKVSGVTEGSPAQLAGILPGDVVVRVGDYPISSLRDFPNAMFFIRVGEYVDIEVLRDSETITFNLPTILLPTEDRFVKIKPLSQEEAQKIRQELNTSESSSSSAAESTQAAKMSSTASIETAPINIPLSPQKNQTGPNPDE